MADLDRFCAFAERFLTDERGRPLVIEGFQREVLATTSGVPGRSWNFRIGPGEKDREMACLSQTQRRKFHERPRTEDPLDERMLAGLLLSRESRSARRNFAVLSQRGSRQ